MKRIPGFEQLEEAQTIDEMRAELFRLYRYDPLVCRVFDTANFNGLSGEDKYVMLSYYAMKDRAIAYQKVLEFSSTSIVTRFQQPK